MAARQGRRVILFERHRRACGASIRNFGMIWPIGQRSGLDHQAALRSRALWLDASRDAGLWCDPCGSLHLAFADDEWEVLAEFAAVAHDAGYDVELLGPDAAAARSPAIRREGLRGAMASATELCVDPRQATRRLPLWLHEQFGVELQFGTTIARVEGPAVVAADGRVWRVDQTVVCSGCDFELLFPDRFAKAGVQRCKLQMLRTVPQPDGWRLQTMLAGGLTLRHYPTFLPCPSLAKLRRRIADETPELDRDGIHVMASQHADGAVTLGDSHEYDEAIEPFDRAEIDTLILRELRRLIDLPDWTIAERWHGVYARLPGRAWLCEQIEPGVAVVNATGGAGMTMAFGLAEQMWRDGGFHPTSQPT